MSFFIPEDSPQRLVLRSVPFFSWLMGLFFIVLGLVGIEYLIHNQTTQLTCEPGDDAAQCHLTYTYSSEPVIFTPDQVQEVYTKKGTRGRQGLRLKLEDDSYLLFYFYGIDGRLPPRSKQIEDVESFFSAPESTRLDLTLSPSFLTFWPVLFVVLFGFLPILTSRTRLLTLDRQTDQATLRERLLFFPPNERTFPLSQIESAHLQTEDGRYAPVHCLELETVDGDRIQISDHSINPNRLFQTAEKIHDFIDQQPT